MGALNGHPSNKKVIESSYEKKCFSKLLDELVVVWCKHASFVHFEFWKLSGVRNRTALRVFEFMNAMIRKFWRP